METHDEFHDSSTRRRDFLKKAAGVVGAASVAAGTLSQAQTAKKDKKDTEEKKDKSNRKLRIGVFGLDYSFWSGLWNELLLPHGEFTGTGILNMEMTCVWDKDTKKAEEFAAKNGCEAVKTYDGMLGKVDGIINGELYNVPWQHLLLKPYLEAGVPCYLSRPWSSCIRDMNSMLELSAKHNAPIIATNTYEHYSEGESLQNEVKNIGPIQAAFATCTAGDHPHFHIPYMMKRILGFDNESVSVVSNDIKKIAYMNVNHVYPAKEGQPSYVLSMNANVSAYIFSLTIVGKNGTITANMPASTNYMWRFASQLFDMQKTFDTKTNYQPLDVVRKKFESCIAEYYSHYEKGGAPVKVGTVPQDWTYPLWKPNWYDNSDFKD